MVLARVSLGIKRGLVKTATRVVSKTREVLERVDSQGCIEAGGSG